MKYVDEYRMPEVARQAVNRIRATCSRPWTIMEVCGGQTHGLLRHGIPSALSDCIELIHGPGCPVCVTSERAIDFAQHLGQQSNVILCSFGDMLRVPGSTETFLALRSRGFDIRTVYSPIDALTLAQSHPDKEVVFFAVGFETTAPATALALLQAAESGQQNFSILASHVRVLPAMEAIMDSPPNHVQAFLAAGHVCTVTGFEDYHTFARKYRVPVAVTGFEPLDLLQGIFECVTQLEAGQFTAINSYPRAVSEEGNLAAQRIVERVYEAVDQEWRGMGIIRSGGFRIRPEFANYDATVKFREISESTDSKGTPVLSQVGNRCRAADVLSGQLKPNECPEFGQTCTPESPLGAPMVSSEGACAAWYRYRPGTQSFRSPESA